MKISILIISEMPRRTTCLGEEEGVARPWAGQAGEQGEACLRWGEEGEGHPRGSDRMAVEERGGRGEQGAWGRGPGEEGEGRPPGCPDPRGDVGSGGRE
jgi:hypothetical protein